LLGHIRELYYSHKKLVLGAIQDGEHCFSMMTMQTQGQAMKQSDWPEMFRGEVVSSLSGLPAILAEAKDSHML
jgi:hypothetical protein